MGFRQTACSERRTVLKFRPRGRHRGSATKELEKIALRIGDTEDATRPAGALPEVEGDGHTPLLEGIEE
jgi:hypothetical protein